MAKIPNDIRKIPNFSGMIPDIPEVPCNFPELTFSFKMPFSSKPMLKTLILVFPKTVLRLLIKT